MDEATVSRIGRYQILRPLGRGSMGVVYLAEDPALERHIALKTIDLAFAVPEPERDAFELRFLTEARVAAKLSHPGIVIVHDVGRDAASGILFIALEYLQGRTLADLVVHDAPLPWRDALRIVAGLARALHHAHVHGIVHRDVKPANVMLLPSGETKVMDFGIAKVPHAQLTTAGQFFGTPLYMSPEQAQGEAVDGRADLFSLGAIAYVLLTGRPAFQADNVLQVLERVTRGQPTAASSLVAGLPPAVDVLLARALAKDPDDRYPDGETMAAAAEDVLAGRAVDPGELELLDDEPEPLAALLEAPPTVTTPPAGFVRRHAPAIGWGALLLALLALVVLALRPRSEGTAAPEPTARKAPAETGSRKAASEPERDAPPPVLPVGRADMARLAVDFEHHLASGTLRVWVDEDQVLEEELDARVTRKVLTVPWRKGNIDQVLQVAPGRHRVRVQVSWDDNVKSRWITGEFKAGVERTLQIRVSRILNGLSLRWV